MSNKDLIIRVVACIIALIGGCFLGCLICKHDVPRGWTIEDSHSETADDAKLIIEMLSLESPDAIEVEIKRGPTTDEIRDLGKSGRICEVFGHQWREGDCTDISGFLYDDLTYHDPFGYDTIYHRECKLCGLYQTRKLTDWE